MEKMIKTTDTTVAVETSLIMAVKIGDFIFETEEPYFWIEVYSVDGVNKTLIAEIDGDDMPVLSESEEGYEDLKRVCLNWYFNNVEIVKDIEPIEEPIPYVEGD